MPHLGVLYDGDDQQPTARCNIRDDLRGCCPTQGSEAVPGRVRRRARGSRRRGRANNALIASRQRGDDVRGCAGSIPVRVACCWKSALIRKTPLPPRPRLTRRDSGPSAPALGLLEVLPGLPPVDV
jgi:hypothetical protein